MTAPIVACPVEDCDFTVQMRLPDIKRSPFILDNNPELAIQEATVRAATSATEHVVKVLNDHGARDHDPIEFEAACQAVKAGLR